MKRVFLIVALVVAFAAPAALADNGTSKTGYGGQAQVQDEVTQTGGGGGTLPLTGTDLGLLVVGGGLFAAAGLAMRRVGRNRK
jgi:opacity protein-like surface antigen